MTKALARYVIWSLSLALWLAHGVAHAQRPGDFPRLSPPQSKPAQPPPPSNAPVTHAASGASDDTLKQLGGAEATLPPNPLAIPPEVKDKIGSDADKDREKGRAPKTTRLWIGPWYEEHSGDYSFKTAFPLWLERKQPNDRASLFGTLYYNRRSTHHDADVLFPLFWHLRDDQNYTTVVGPFAHRSAPDAEDNWLFPLFFSGWRKNGSGYLHMPPLLTFNAHSKDGGFNIVGPYYCFFKGTSTCSQSKANDIDYGFFPLFAAGKNERSRYEFVPPLLHYFHYNEIEDSSINVWGPLVWKHSKEQDLFDLFPFFFHLWGKNEEHITLFPLFHYGYSGNSNLFVNPLFLTARGEHGESTFATYLYARYRGRTKLDMVTPLYWHYEDPDIQLTRTLVAPFFYMSKSPRGYDTAVIPFYLHSYRPNISETTWVTPFFQHTHDLEGWATNFYPFLFLGRTNDSTHTVLFPFFWDFASPKSRTTIGFPLLWRFADQQSVSELVGNVYYHQQQVNGGLDWEIHIFPAFSYGETPDGHWWNVLYGLAGYTRRGPMTKMRALWVPITLTE
jgi:hypothetical protein